MTKREKEGQNLEVPTEKPVRPVKHSLGTVVQGMHDFQCSVEPYLLDGIAHPKTQNGREFGGPVSYLISTQWAFQYSTAD